MPGSHGGHTGLCRHVPSQGCFLGLAPGLMGPSPQPCPPGAPRNSLSPLLHPYIPHRSTPEPGVPVPAGGGPSVRYPCNPNPPDAPKPPSPCYRVQQVQATERLPGHSKETAGCEQKMGRISSRKKDVALSSVKPEGGHKMSRRQRHRGIRWNRPSWS